MGKVNFLIHLLNSKQNFLDDDYESNIVLVRRHSSENGEKFIEMVFHDNSVREDDAIMGNMITMNTRF